MGWFGRKKYDIRSTDFDKNGIQVNGGGFNHRGFDRDFTHGITGTNFDPYGFDNYGLNKDGFDKDGIDGTTGTRLNTFGFDKDGIDGTTGTRLNTFGFDKHLTHGITGMEFNASGIHPRTGTRLNEYGFDCDGIHGTTGTRLNTFGFDREGYDEDGFDNINGFDKYGLKQFTPTSKFLETVSSSNSDFDAFVTLAYNEPTKIKSKLFFSHDKKIGIYSKSFESFSNNNMVHFHIEKAGKQYGTNWNKPKKTDFDQGDNFESGYTLNVTFNKNDSKLKSVLIKKLGKINFGSFPSEYTLDCHLNEEYPNDERAKELLHKVVELFNSENTHNKKFVFPDILHDVYFQPDDD